MEINLEYDDIQYKDYLIIKNAEQTCIFKLNASNEQMLFTVINYEKGCLNCAVNGTELEIIQKENVPMNQNLTYFSVGARINQVNCY